MFAQSLSEYGALASIVAGLQHEADTIRSSLASVSPTTWMILAAVLLVIVVARSARARR